MTKANIIQRLLEEQKITVSEAMILMTQEPTHMPILPVQPYSPNTPDWTWDPNQGPWFTYTTSTRPIYNTQEVPNDVANSNISYSDTKWPTDSE